MRSKQFAGDGGKPSPVKRRGSGKSDSEHMDQVRDGLLKASPDDYFVQPEGDEVWGVVFEFTWKAVPVIVMGLSNGSGTVFTTKGAGIFGGGENPKWRATAELLCEKATAARAEFHKAKRIYGPDVGSVRFNILLPSGVQTAQATEAQLRSEHHKLSAMYFVGHRLLTSILEESEAA